MDPVGERLEHEQRAPVQDVLVTRRCGCGQNGSIPGAPALLDDNEALVAGRPHTFAASQITPKAAKARHLAAQLDGQIAHDRWMVLDRVPLGRPGATNARRSRGRSREDGERSNAAVEDQCPGRRIHVPGAEPLVTAEARAAEDEERSRVPAGRTKAPCEHGLVRVDEIAELQLELPGADDRAEDHCVGLVPLLPQRALVERTRLVSRQGESETQLAELLGPVHVRPEQALDLPPRRDGVTSSEPLPSTAAR